MDYILKAVLPNTSLKHLSIGKNFTRLKYNHTDYFLSVNSDVH